MIITGAEASGTHVAGTIIAPSADDAYDQVVAYIQRIAPTEMIHPGDLSNKTIDEEWRINLIASQHQPDPNTITYHFRADAPE